MKTRQQIEQEIAEECGEKSFDVLLESEINVGDYKTAKFIMKRASKRFLKQFTN